jgi:hypothetical protein
MLPVPYSLYALKAGSATPDFKYFTFDPLSNSLKNNGTTIADLTSLHQSLEYDPLTYHLSISGKPGIVDFRQFAHAPQDLRYLNNKIWITGNKDSTVVDLSPYKQTLSVSSTSKLQISGGNEVQVDTSNTNEIQTLLLLNNKLSLTKGGGEVTIDASETNEIQDLTLTGNTLKVTNNAAATAIDLSKYVDNTDNQTLERSGSNLSITGGNQMDVSDMINLPWAGFSSYHSGSNTPSGVETLLTWLDEYDPTNVLDNNKFIAPSTCIYNLRLIVSFKTSRITNIVKIYKGTTVIRQLKTKGDFVSTNLLINLLAGETISIYALTLEDNNTAAGNFSGFRVN